MNSSEGWYQIHDASIDILSADLVVTGLVSAVDQMMEIDVLPRHDPNLLRLGTRQLIPVVIFGSEDLATSDVDRTSLRLGPTEVQPVNLWGHTLIFQRDLNRDGHSDVFAVFRLNELELVYGDAELCLLISARTHDGATLEGCDSIDTVPLWPRRHGRWRRH